MKLQRETLTRTMAKSTLHVFVELALEYPKPLSVNELAQRTAVSRNAVGNAVSYLESIGAVVRNGRYASQLTLGMLEEFLDLFPVDNFTDAAADFFKPAAGCTKRVHPMHKKSASPSSSSSYTDLNKNGESSEEEEGIPEELKEVLKASGVGRNMWPGLARLEWITPDYVAAHTAYRRYKKEPVRFQMQRMLNEDEAPALPEKGNECAFCGRPLGQSYGVIDKKPACMSCEVKTR